MGRRLAMLATFAVLATPAAACGGDGSDDDGGGRGERPGAREASERERGLVGALRRGGLVLAFRHAASDPDPTGEESLSSCSTQRMLTARGRADAKAIGRAFRALAIPVADVRSSPMCRTRDTARLAFGRARLDRDLTSMGTAMRPGDGERRVRELRRLLRTDPPDGRNVVLVSHTPNFGEAADISLEEGEMAAFRARGRRGFRLVARVKPEEWRRLVRVAAAG